jgi:predicted regulator of Ras-like GTPase activity (Roadblock/LC7/MglB family)
MQENFVIYNEEYTLIRDILQRLKISTKAKIVFITDLEGHCIASTGELDEVNLNSISSLIAGSVAAIQSIAQMLRLERFNGILNESTRESLHISLINDRTMLIVIFDNTSNLGLVRFRVRSALDELEKVFLTIQQKIKASEVVPGISPFEGVTDEDIDRIFGD